MAKNYLEGYSSMKMREVCEHIDFLDNVWPADRHICGDTSLNTNALDMTSASLYFGFCAFISHMLLAGITFIIVHKCVSLKMVHTAGHAFYCTIAFVFILGEALLVRHSRNLELWIGKFNLDLLHSTLGVLAFVVGVGGVAIKILQKLERKREDPTATVKHFRSNHGLFGIIGCVLLLCCVLSGLPLYFITSKVLQLVHRFCALASFGTLMISQMFSYNTGFATRQWKPHHVRWFKLFTFIVTITTMNYEFRRLAREIISLISNQF